MMPRTRYPSMTIWAAREVQRHAGRSMLLFACLASLVFLKKLDPLMRKDRYLTLTVTAEKRMELYDELQLIFDEQGLNVSDLSSNVDLVNDEIFFQMVVTQHQKRIGRELTGAILQLDGIKKVHYH